MVSLKTLKPHLLSTLLRHQKPSLITQTPHIRFYTNTQCVSSEGLESSEMVREFKNLKGVKKPLVVLFKEAVGLSEKTLGESESSDDDDEEEKGYELKKKLRKIEREVRNMKGIAKKPKKEKNALVKKKEESVLVEEGPKVNGLFSMFASKPESAHTMFVKGLDSKEKAKSLDGKEKAKSSDCEERGNVSEKTQGEGSMELKTIEEISPEMILLIKLLHEKGYFEGANFLPSTKLDLSCFNTHYARGYVKSAAERFGKDHPELGKYLSEIDMKRLVLFGCPSFMKKTAFASKRLRSYFNIQEDIVCRPCKMNSSCKHRFCTPTKKILELDMVDLMKILTLYGLELVPTQLTVPDEVKDSISTLVNQVIEHSENTI